MRTFLTAALAGALLAGCGTAQTTGSAANGWSTPTGYASATRPVDVDSSSGAIRNSAARHDGTYDSRYNNEVNAPSDFGRVPPPAEAPPAEVPPAEVPPAEVP
jgi:hypothetical protein